MWRLATNGGELALFASKACLCVSGIALAAVSFTVLTHSPDRHGSGTDTVASHLASLHPPVPAQNSPAAQSALQPAKSAKKAESTKQPPARPAAQTLQDENIKLASLRGPYFGSKNEVVEERVTAKPLPWGVHLTASWSREKALKQYDRIRKRYSDALSGKDPMVVRVTNHSMGSAERYLVRIGQADREEAEQLCARLKEAGGACVVYKARKR